MCALRGAPLSPTETWGNSKGANTPCQVADYIGPLPMSGGYQYAMTCVDAATGLFVAFPACCADQRTTKRGLGCLFAAYGQLQVIESDQGTYFTGHAL